MGLSYPDAERLGLAREHPDHPSRRGEADAPAAKPKPRRTTLNDRGQNKTEAKFDAYLADLKAAGAILGYWFEPLKLRIAGNTWYRVDFLVKRADGSLAGVEIKGFLRDDASIKVKDAADDHPWLAVYLVRKDKLCYAGWDVRAVTRTGIGRHPIGKEWLER